MLHKSLFVACLAVLALLATSSKVQAWGAAHVGYTHVGPYGAYHVGGTAFGGGYGGYRYGGGYGYGGGYRYGGYGGYGYGGYGGVRAGYARYW